MSTFVKRVTRQCENPIIHYDSYVVSMIILFVYLLYRIVLC